MKTFFRFALMCTGFATAIISTGCNRDNEEERPDKEWAIVISNNIEHGSVTATIGTDEVTAAKAGASVVLEATGDEGYKFLRWDIEGVSVPTTANATFTFPMPSSDIAVSALFEQITEPTWPINILQAENGTVVAKVNGESVTEAEENSTVELIATPANGKYVFKKWTVSDNITSLSDAETSPATFTMPSGAVDISAEFHIPAFAIVIDPTIQNGRIEVSVNGGSVLEPQDLASIEAGTPLTLHAVADPEYSFVCWENISGITIDEEDMASNDRIFTMPANAVGIGAVFEEKVVLGPTDFDPLLDNQWWYDGETTDITWTGFEESGNHINFMLSDKRPTWSPWILMLEGIGIFLPKTTIGQETTMAAGGGWELTFDNTDESGTYTNHMDFGSLDGVQAGKYSVEFDKDTKTVTVRLAVHFSDGTVLKAHYHGYSEDLNNLDNDPSLAYDETLDNQYKYDGQVYDINYAAVETEPNNVYPGHYFYFAENAPYRQPAENAPGERDGWREVFTDMVKFHIPTASYGSEVGLTFGSSIRWFHQFFIEGVTDYDAGQAGRPGDIAAGKFLITKEGLNITLKGVVKYRDGKIMQVKYSGPAVDRDPVSGVGTGSYTYTATSPVQGSFNQTYLFYNPDIDTYEIALCKDIVWSVRTCILQNVEHCVLLNIPGDLLGQDIDLGQYYSANEDYFTWAFAFNGSVARGEVYEGYGIEDWVNPGLQKIDGGTMRLDKNGDSYSVSFDVTFSDGTSLAGSYDGTLGSTPLSIWWWSADYYPYYR